LLLAAQRSVAGLVSGLELASVQQLDARSGPLADLAHEIGARLARVAQNLSNIVPSGGIG
jgi:hypothetical protein